LKRITARIVLFTLLGLGSLESAGSLTLEQALDAALKNNADLQKNAVTLQQAKRDKDNAWNMFLPSLSASLGISNNHVITPKPKNEVEPLWPWSASISASLGFTAAIPARIKLLNIKEQAAEENYQNEIRKLTSSVSTSFYALLAEKLNIEILRSDLEVKQQQYEQITRNYRNGLASELDMLNSQYTFQTAGPALNDAVVKYEQNIATFLLLIGIDAKTDVTPEGIIEIKMLALPPVDTLVAAFLENRYDVKTQTNALEQTKLNAAIEGVSRVPSISLSESLSLRSGADAFSDPSTLAGSFSVSISVPISAWIPGSSQNINVKTAAEKKGTDAITLDALKKSAEQDIWKKVDEIERITENMGSTELNYRIAQRAFELSEQGYRGGLVSQTDLQTANQRMVSANQTVVTAKISYLTAVYNLASSLSLDVEELYRLYATDKE
jgi:multidrug efflux system outer membrane protein